MDAVRAQARSGYALVLDQCPRCGGIWCDRWELYPITAAAAADLDPLDAPRLQAPPASPAQAGRCPRCTAALRPFRDPALPADARIERCPVCDGMWLNRGSLARAKGVGATTPSGNTTSLIARLGSSLGARPPWSEVRNLDAATYAADPDAPDDALDWRGALSSLVPWLALAALVRLLLR